MQDLTKALSIIGSGTTALVLSLAALRQGWRVKLYAEKPKHNNVVNDLRAYALNAATVKLLKTIDLWQAPEFNHVTPVRVMQLCLAQSYARLDATKVHAEALAWVVRAQDLENAAWAMIDTLLRQKNDCIALSNQRVIAIQKASKGLTLTSSDGSQHYASTLVLAEGKNAQLAEQLGFASKRFDYQMLAHVANLSINNGTHHHTAWQFFSNKRILALLPLKHEGHEQYACICHQRGEHALSATQFSEVLNALPAQTRLHKPARFMTEVQTWPLQSIERSPIATNHCFLMGDALRTVHPLAGQGFNLACADINAWLNAHSNLATKPELIQRRYAAQVFWSSAGLQRLIDHLAKINDYEQYLPYFPTLQLERQPPWLSLQRLAYQIASGKQRWM